MSHLWGRGESDWLLGWLKCSNSAVFMFYNFEEQWMALGSFETQRKKDSLMSEWNKISKNEEI